MDKSVFSSVLNWPLSFRDKLDRFFLAAGFSFALCIYFFSFGDRLVDALQSENWVIGPTMMLGSFVGGLTCLGGGAVAFPVLTKLLALDAVAAKSFSLAIQSVGMTSASLFIVLRVKSLPWKFIITYCCSSSLAVVFSLQFVSANVPNLAVKLFFTLFMLCFVVVYLGTKSSALHSNVCATIKTNRQIYLVAVVGLCGGALSSVLGSGADFLAFCLLSFYFRLDIKVATQCSVIVMAVTSLAAMSAHSSSLLSSSAQLVPMLLIAIPVVVVGGPIGAMCCRVISNFWLKVIVSALVLVEVLTTVLKLLGV